MCFCEAEWTRTIAVVWRCPMRGKCSNLRQHACIKDSPALIKKYRWITICLEIHIFLISIIMIAYAVFLTHDKYMVIWSEFILSKLFFFHWNIQQQLQQLSLLSQASRGRPLKYSSSNFIFFSELLTWKWWLFIILYSVQLGNDNYELSDNLSHFANITLPYSLTLHASAFLLSDYQIITKRFQITRGSECG
jgi:hypothetical protein